MKLQRHSSYLRKKRALAVTASLLLVNFCCAGGRDGGRGRGGGPGWRPGGGGGGYCFCHSSCVPAACSASVRSLPQ
jgi:hypothetical protein